MIQISVRGVTFLAHERPGDSFWRYMNSGEWENETFDIIDRVVTGDTTVLDIGAWIGPIALYAAQKARQVLAFEPDPVAFAELERNVSANSLNNIELVNAAISDTPGTVRLGANNNVGDSGSSILRADHFESWEVPAIRLDTFIAERGLDGPLFIKIDVEGFEYRLIPHLMPALRGRDFVLHLSTHPSILWESIPAHSNLGRLVRRARMIRAQWTLLRALRFFQFLGDDRLQPLRPALIVPPLLRGRSLTPSSAIVVASHRQYI